MSNQQAARMLTLSRHAFCESEMRTGVRTLVDAACSMGFTREEALVAISDAADAELADLT